MCVFKFKNAQTFDSIYFRVKSHFEEDGTKNVLVLKNGDILNVEIFQKGCWCHYWYLIDKGLKYEPHLYNGCHDLMQKAMN